MATPHGSGPATVQEDTETPRPHEPEPPAAPRSRGRRLFAALFDLSFEGFVAPGLVKLLYELLLILLTIGALVQVVGAFGAMAYDGAVLLGLLWLALTPVFWLLGVMIFRGLLQLTIAATGPARMLRQDL